MLEDIIISRVRVKILNLFLNHSGELFHVREIVRQTKEEINAVRRELAHMEKCGMVSKEPRANRLYYSFKKDYPLYFELLELVAKSSNLGYAIYKNKNKIGKVKFLMLSGKFIRNAIRRSDEIDLLAIGNIVVPQLVQYIKEEEARKDTEINFTVMTEEELNFRKRRKDPFIWNILMGSRLMIIGDEEELVKI